MLTVGDKVKPFVVVGVKPGALAPEAESFELLTHESFPGKWKIVVFYPKDFTFVCPTEITEYDKLVPEFEQRDAVLMVGSTDNEYSKLAWRLFHQGLKQTKHWSFADQKRFDYTNFNPEDDMTGLADRLGAITKFGFAHRATFIIDPDNVIQHVTVNNDKVGRNPQETLRVLDALQTGKLAACNRPIGGETLS